MTGLKILRKEKMIILDHRDISTDPLEFRMVVGERERGPCFIRHLAKPPRLICISVTPTVAAATMNKAALNFYSPVDNAAASGGRATTWAHQY